MRKVLCQSKSYTHWNHVWEIWDVLSTIHSIIFQSIVWIILEFSNQKVENYQHKNNFKIKIPEYFLCIFFVLFLYFWKQLNRLMVRLQYNLKIIHVTYEAPAKKYRTFYLIFSNSFISNKSLIFSESVFYHVGFATL